MFGKGFEGSVRRPKVEEEKSKLPLGLSTLQTKNARTRLQGRPITRLATRSGNCSRESGRRMSTTQQCGEKMRQSTDYQEWEGSNSLLARRWGIEFHRRT